nr:hypothetical protein BV87_14605 [Sphingobium yanoikuyae]
MPAANGRVRTPRSRGKTRSDHALISPIGPGRRQASPASFFFAHEETSHAPLFIAFFRPADRPCRALRGDHGQPLDPRPARAACRGCVSRAGHPGGHHLRRDHRRHLRPAREYAARAARGRDRQCRPDARGIRRAR